MCRFVLPPVVRFLLHAAEGLLETESSALHNERGMGLPPRCRRNEGSHISEFPYLQSVHSVDVKCTLPFRQCGETFRW
jgi:hypothetical protein